MPTVWCLLEQRRKRGWWVVKIVVKSCRPLSFLFNLNFISQKRRLRLSLLIHTGNHLHLMGLHFPSFAKRDHYYWAFKRQHTNCAISLSLLIQLFVIKLPGRHAEFFRLSTLLSSSLSSHLLVSHYRHYNLTTCVA